MSIEIFFQVIESIAVVIAVGFAIVQVRQYRRDKHREAAMELLHAFQAPDFTKALCIVYAMPEGLSEEEMKRLLAPIFTLFTPWPRRGEVLAFSFAVARLTCN